MPFILRKTITETFLERVRITPRTVGFRHKKDGVWTAVTFREFHDECRLISFGLMGLGIQPGDRVAILSETRFEWALCDMAILGASAVTVPIYASSTPGDVRHILNHSEARIVLAESAGQLSKLLSQREALPKLEKIVVLEPAAVLRASGDKDVLTLQALREIGKREEARTPMRFQENLASARPDGLLTICYTSGTTGLPKGVMLTHDNLMSVLEDCVKSLSRKVRSERETLVAFLPFSHIIGKVESMATYCFGWCEWYAESIEQLMDNIADARPTLLFAVPRIFEKAYARVRASLEEGPEANRRLFALALDAGHAYYDSVWNNLRPSPLAFARYQLARRAVFRKILARFGGRLKYAICGGAPLPQDIAEFFQITGIPILEGYGLTETCAPVTLNSPDASKIGTVGRPLPDVSLKIQDDGEIVVKSRKVFKGYYKDDEATREAIVDGWFHTGDIGRIDDEGFLHITDRKKDLIITSGGKNIAPQKIENMARAREFISQFVVQGDRRNYLTALVTLDREQLTAWANEQKILFSEFSELVKHAKVHTLIQRIVDELNSHLASFETIKKFIILPNEFTIESGELTPSMKVKRDLIAKRYKAELDSLYA
jgi:long-chain acyl-CoA synthetase